MILAGLRYTVLIGMSTEIDSYLHFPSLPLSTYTCTHTCTSTTTITSTTPLPPLTPIWCYHCHTTSHTHHHNSL